MPNRRALILMTAASVLTAVSALPARAGQDELVLFEEAGCAWCERWDREIAHIYPKTPEGQAAPLRRVDRRGALPADLVLKSRLVYTPTFVLVRDGRELARIEGYPGEDFFWGLLGLMLKQNTGFAEAS